VIASVVAIDASATIGFEAFGNAFTIDNAGAGNVVVVTAVTAFATGVVVDGVLTVGPIVVDVVVAVGATVVAVVVVGEIVVGVVLVGTVVVVDAEPALGAAATAASRMNHAAAELGSIMPEVALLEPTARH
jgi:hypothetical protein